ncbi:MAG: sensor histidine kinase [Gammaproteobacteria bacterium]|nr:sensor histidine kinase [Gammaproteobacteria bacterium]
MSLAPDSATSIRRRLLIFLLPSLAVLMLAGVYTNYRAAMLFVQAAYDRRLADSALALATHIRITDREIHVDAAPQAQPAAGTEHADLPAPFYYSILGPGGRLLAGNPQLPTTQPGSANPTYADVRLATRELRLATYRLPTAGGTVIINVAEASDWRARPGHFILASTWLMDFIQVDVTLLLVWVAVHFGLKPLTAVRRQIEARSARELRPLEVAAVPSEVRPLVDALNLLFEMLSEAARSQRQFVADTAHQLRTPITGLLGHLELLMREPAAVPLQSRLAALHDELTRLAHSANQLLALARADPSANLTDKFESIELKSLVERVIEQHFDRSVEGGIDMGAEAQATRVNGSPRLLEDLLGNLVDNALNYTPKGGRVTVRSGFQDGRPYLEVEDDGPGIPEAERVRVRQRFYRLPGSPGRGCGLGLAIVEEISQLHRGVLTIEAGANARGTRIRVQFPPAGAPAANQPARHRETATSISS